MSKGINNSKYLNYSLACRNYNTLCYAGCYYFLEFLKGRGACLFHLCIDK